MKKTQHAVLLILSNFAITAAAIFGLNTHANEAMEILVVTGKAPENLGIEAELAEIARTPGGVTLIDTDTLNERNVSSLADMLRFVPGVWSASDTGDENIFFSSRGSNLDSVDYDMNGIKLLQDGLPVTMADGTNHNRMIDPLSAQYATFARGANAMTYGASTLGGAINFVTPTAYDTAPIELALNGGSYGQLNARATFSKVFNDRFDGLLTIEGKQWNGYRDHNELDRHGIYANAAWKFSDSVSSRFYATYLKNDRELTSALTRAEVNADPSQAGSSALGANRQVDVGTWRLANKTTWIIDANQRLDIGFSYEEQSLFHPIVDRVLIDFDGPGPAAPVEVFSLLIDTDHKNLGTMMRYNHKLLNHDLLFGINYGYSWEAGAHFRNLGGTRNGLTNLLDNEASSLEVYAMDRWQFTDNWMLVYGAQFVTAERDMVNTTIASNTVSNPGDDYTGLNPRAGLIYSLTDNASLYANVSRLYEAPTNFQLEDNVAGGSATLDAMSGTALEIGTRGTREVGQNQLQWDVAWYYTWLRDEILSVDDPLAPGNSLVTNIDASVHAGIEGLLAYHRAMDQAGVHSIDTQISVSVNNFYFDDDPIHGNKDLPAAPTHVVKGEILYRHAGGFYLGPTFDWVGKRYGDFANTYEVDCYTLLGLRAGWSKDRWRVFAELRNLLDENYIASHSVRDIAAANADILNPGEPLSAYMGVQWRY